MSQPSEPKSSSPLNSPVKEPAKSNQPTLTELSPEQLDTVSGGQKVSTSDINFVKLTDKASAN